ncbi:MAG: CapA family protein [Clostridiales bacterium]|nr:CapA family protein [Clostridiales bacterium]
MKSLARIRRLLPALLCALFLFLFLFVFIFFSSGRHFLFEASAVESALEAKDPDLAPPEPGRLPTPTPEPPRDVVRQAKIVIVGDLMVHSPQMQAAYNKSSNSYDFTTAFAPVAAYIQSAELAVGNLETVLGGPEIGYSEYPRFNTPDAYAEALAGIGFDFFSTANNHSNDKGEAGILRTIKTLDSIGIKHTGTFASPEERDTISILEANTMRIALLSYTYGTNGLPLVKGHDYTVNLLDKALVEKDIKRAKEQNPDFIIVIPHMGVEYAEAPNAQTTDMVSFMLNAGADVVAASHPHVLQKAGFQKASDGRTCFAAFSLGNFISSQRTIPRDTGVILTLYLEKVNDEKAEITRASIIPTWNEYINRLGAYDVRVMSIFDALNDRVDLSPGIREKDLPRLITAHSHAMKILTGATVPTSEMKEEYFIYRPK